MTDDIVDRIVWPGRYFGAREEDRNIFERYGHAFRTLYKYTPTRRSGLFLARRRRLGVPSVREPKR